MRHDARVSQLPPAVVQVLRQVVARGQTLVETLDPPPPEPPLEDADLPVYMHPVEWSQVLAAVSARSPKRVLEWGSGGSTRALLRRVPSIERLVSIEHDPDWHKRVATLIDDARLHYHLVEAAEPYEGPFDDGPRFVAWVEEAERRREMFDRYVDHPKTLDETFDLVIVDGRARRFCIPVGWELLEPGGVLIVHDAQREAYHPALRDCGEPLFFEPWHQGQVALVAKPV